MLTIKPNSATSKCLPLTTIFLVGCQLLLTTKVNSFVLPTHHIVRQLQAGLRDDAGDSAALSAFADSLERPKARAVQQQSTQSRPTPYLSSEDNYYEDRSWQASLEKLLDPLTPLSQRQILLSDLLNSNEEIRNSVLTALRDRKVL